MSERLESCRPQPSRPKRRIDFAQEMALINKMQQRLARCTESSLPAKSLVKVESLETLSLDTDGSVGSILQEHKEIRDGLREIDRFTDSYHLAVEKQINELMEEKKQLALQNEFLRRKLLSSDRKQESLQVDY